MKLSNDSIWMANNKEFNQFNWTPRMHSISLWLFFLPVALCFYAVQSLDNIQTTKDTSKWHMRQNIMHTFSGKNGNSIFVFYSIHFFLSVHSFDQIVVVVVVVINYKDFPYIRGAKVGWWHKNHYMRRLCHRIVNFNKCVPRVSEWVCVYGFAFMGAAIWIDIGAVRSL